MAAGGTIDLKGGLIVYTADPKNNELSATALTYSDIENASSASTSGYGIVLSPSGIPTPAVDMPAKQNDHGAALATLSPGKVTLSSQQQDLASLNTDIGKANTQAEFYDIHTLKRRQESAAAVSQLLNTAIGDISKELGFEDGSAQKIALHAAVGALTAVVSGGNIGLGAFAGGFPGTDRRCCRQGADGQSKSDAGRAKCTQPVGVSSRGHGGRWRPGRSNRTGRGDFSIGSSISKKPS